MSTDDDWVIWDTHPNARMPLCGFAHRLGEPRWLPMTALKVGYRPHGTKREYVEEYIKRGGYSKRITGTWSIVRLPDALALLDMRLAREAVGA